MREKTYQVENFAVKVAFVMLIILLLGIPQTCLGTEKDKNNMPVDSDVSVTYIAKGDVIKAGKATFTLIAKDEDAPMPKGSTNGEKTITINGPGEKSFGNIRFVKPEVYEYTVVRDDEKPNACKTFDNSKYNVKIMALNSGEVEQIITKPGSKTKLELAYTDVFESTPPSHTKTGDSFNPIIAGMIAGVALTIILLIITGRRRRRYED